MTSVPRSRRFPALHVEPASPDPVRADARWRMALAAAAEGSADELASARDGGWPVGELRAVAALLVASVEQCLSGFTAGHVAFSPAMPVRRQIDAMRRLLLAQAREHALDATDTVRVVDALETIATRLDEDAGHRFASRLCGMDGLSLIVDVAHDMRSPLGSILFLAEQIRRGSSGDVTPIQERQLGLIYGAALGLSTMASDVMDLARGGELMVSDTPRQFSLQSVFRHVHDLVRPMAEERGLSLRFETRVTDVRIGHGTAVQRILLNLVTNALKFTTVGEVAVHATAVDSKRVRFEVRDTGHGIPDSVLDTLFDAFRRRLKPGQYIFSSAGLGLSICQSLVDAMGSELIVESSAAAGSVFRFELELPCPPSP
jgi:signal transduction histidine kinase